MSAQSEPPPGPAQVTMEVWVEDKADGSRGVSMVATATSLDIDEEEMAAVMQEGADTFIDAYRGIER